MPADRNDYVTDISIVCAQLKLYASHLEQLIEDCADDHPIIRTQALERLEAVHARMPQALALREISYAQRQAAYTKKQRENPT
jgi:hypothetical protein